MDERIINAAIAGLLHDIGKFALRAGEGASRTWDIEAQRDYGHKHALLTEDFIERYVPDGIRLAVKGAAGSHHRPNHRLGYALALADRLSAGERSDETPDNRDQQPRQLLSVFCSLTADDEKAPQSLYLPLTDLRIDESALFPQPLLAPDKVWKQYEALWRGFQEQAAKLRDALAQPGDEELYLEALQPLLQRYTWSIPSAYYKAVPDISLYDHDRVSGALAAILASGSLSDAELKTFSADPKSVTSQLAVLVGGDITGVQDFIYTITARGATSALRGRSFYLQLLTQVTARYILRRLDLPITNLVYSGGGNFYLLARPEDQEKLTEVQREVSRILLGQHHGDLYLALASIPLAGPDFYNSRISQRWGELTELMNQAKLRKYSELGADIAEIFVPLGDGGNEDRQCQVCGMEHPQTQTFERESGRDPVRKCPACSSYEELGDQLRRASYLVFTPIPIAPPGSATRNHAGGWDDVMRAFGQQVEVLAALRGNERGIVFALNDTAYHDLAPRSGMAPSRQFLVNVTPQIEAEEIGYLRGKGIVDLPAPGSIKPFHAMEAQSRGVKRLGVLRMDVDNVGRLFSEGLGEKASLSRVASLSLAISLYFEGWVGLLAQQQNQAGRTQGKEYGDRVYSIYSGGDDLFFVGAWDAVVELARQARADLTRYAAGHPGIHASGGVVLIDGKQPLSQAAESAREAEELAKAVRWMQDGKERRKDGFTFLGQSLPWFRFGTQGCEVKDLSSAHALMHLLEDFVERYPEKRSLLRRLIRLHERYLEAVEERRKSGSDQNRSGEPQTLWGPWNWLSEYMLQRMEGKEKNPEIHELRERLKKDQFRSIEWIGLAARWTELIKRS